MLQPSYWPIQSHYFKSLYSIELIAHRGYLDIVRSVPGTSSLELIATQMGSQFTGSGIFRLAQVVSVDIKDNGRRIRDKALVTVVQLIPGVLCFS